MLLEFFLQTPPAPKANSDFWQYSTYVLILTIVGLWSFFKSQLKENKTDQNETDKKSEERLVACETKYKELHDLYLNEKNQQIDELKSARDTLETSKQEYLTTIYKLQEQLKQKDS